MYDYPGLSEFCQDLYEKNIRSPYLMSFIVDCCEEMLENKCGDKDKILQKALNVSIEQRTTSL